MTGRFADNPAYVQYERLLCRLHQLIAQGGCDSPAADALREEMETPERLLNRAEKNRLSGLSADLYLLSNDEILAPAAPSLNPRELLEQIRELQTWNDWESVLALLRRRPGTVPVEAVAITRARAYDALGHTETAMQFLDFAYRNNPSDSDYRAMRMLLASAGGMIHAVEDDAQRVVFGKCAGEKGEVKLNLLVAAADVLVQRADSMAVDARKRLYQEILGALRPATRGELVGGGHGLFVSHAHLLRASCFWQLNQRSDTVAALDAAVESDPGDGVMRRVRDEIKRNLNGAGATTGTTDEVAEIQRVNLSIVRAIDHRRDLQKRIELPGKLAA